MRLPIKVCVRVKGDGIEIDLTGSADQVETGFNVPFEGSTKVACFCAIRSLLLDAETSEIKVPSNQGSFRPIDVITPKGSIFNPKFPAAAEARFSQINRVIDLIYKALAPVLPNDIREMPARFAGLRVSEGDVMAFYGPCGGGYGDPLERPPEQVRDDVLDDFCTVEHARQAYGVVVDLDTESVDLRATEALRSRIRADPRRGERRDSSPATIDRRGDGARPEPRAVRASSAADPARATGSGEHRPGAAPDSTARRVIPLPAASPAGAPSIEDLVARLNARLGEGWSFDVLRHQRNGGGIEVVAELGANGTRVQRTGASNGNGHLSLGAQLEIASEAAFRSCTAEMLGEAGRISG